MHIPLTVVTPTGHRAGAAVLRRAFEPTRRNVLHWASWVAALGFEVAVLAVLRTGEVFAWEQSMTRAFQEVAFAEPVFEVTSTLTNTLSVPFAALFIAIVAAAWIAGERRAAFLLALSFPLHVLAQFPKAFVDRPRPSPAFEGIEGVGGLQSFPSGHAEYVVAFYGFIALLLWRRCRGRWARVAILLGWSGFVLATGFGRIAAGRHWPLDVLTSYVVGAGLLSGLIWLDSALRGPPPSSDPEPAAYTG